MNLTVLIGQLMMVVTITQSWRSYRPQKWQRPAADKQVSAAKKRLLTFRRLFKQIKINAMKVIAEQNKVQTLNQLKKVTNGYKY